ncbi:arginine/lysine/ornithine decarboxylase [Staphylococcus auricularis]|uniref:Lysine decarboxylase n=1 Tax=Staphylococcus auricularis TaxID=29379 RepID=A0AAP8TT44_9STAP|nr:lysine decarboxylase [Staphylococcus auricularis]MBM0868714.1 lysine decarboxylase [Staphylococcus auricularis]MCG7342270.1 lysine decarboxylase [Staphylococcus auricularis]MDC6328116.1 lysine decarboxylase [Staphylococcus auricularis]MDN4532117.1 lysine decarboxylase [Staphylococcus auricularis]PNZ67495.1 lysine decarboxylase [Staphylococcus auricularis]
MSQPINNKLNQLIRNEAISMHVPGHKNNTIGDLNQLSMAMDMTEITGLDDLHQPEEIIAESMQQLRKHPDYEAYYLVNGTTSGILAVIHAFKHNSGDYLIARNAHKSVFHALELVQWTAKILPMQLSETTYQFKTPLTSSFIEYIKESKLAVFTYPNYYGETFDLASTISELHQQQIPVFIDEAHGAHFGLEGFPNSALTMGADYVVQSYHKTLPALTMGSVLFVHKDAPLQEAVKQGLNYFQTSSPSYLIMASLEAAHTFYQNYDSQRFFRKRQQLIEQLNAQYIEVKEVDDPLKLILTVPGYSGFQLQKVFEAQHIYVELADTYQVLWVLPLWHDGDRYPFDLLLKRIAQIDVQPQVSTEQPSMTSMPNSTALGAYTSATIANSKWVPLAKAQGEILAQHIIPYPPGIPMMFAGEKIGPDMLKLLESWSRSNMTVEGLTNNHIKVKDE